LLETEERGEQRGIEIGEQRGTDRLNRLNAFLIRDKRYSDLEHSTNDPAFQAQLMTEYGI